MYIGFIFLTAYTILWERRHGITINGCCICISSDFYLIWCTGGYGYVFVAQDTKSGKEYALKVCTKSITCTLLNSAIAIVWGCGSVCIYIVHECNWVYGVMNTCTCHVYVYMYVRPNVFPINWPFMSLHCFTSNEALLGTLFFHLVLLPFLFKRYVCFHNIPAAHSPKHILH